jgi:nucleotidyltransferase substrate binding protein (TIGR01987 family)
MSSEDIRWQQRFSNYCKALDQFSEFISKGNLNKLEEQGLIQAFEYTYELAWNTLKDFLQFKGQQNIFGARDAITIAFKEGLIKEGELWMEMFKDRNKTTHTYNETTAKEIVVAITSHYYRLFNDLKDTLTPLVVQ